MAASRSDIKMKKKSAISMHNYTVKKNNQEIELRSNKTRRRLANYF